MEMAKNAGRIRNCRLKLSMKKFLIHLSTFYIIFGFFKIYDLTPLGTQAPESLWFLQITGLGILITFFTIWLEGKLKNES